MPVVGLEQAKRRVRRVPDATRDRLVEVVVRAKTELAQRTAQAAPSRTAALRQAIQPSPRRGLTGFVGIAAGEFRGQRPEVYWRFPEFGTVSMAATPYIVPTAERYGATFLSHVQRSGRDIERDLESRGQRFL